MDRRRMEPGEEFGGPERLLALSKETKDLQLVQRCLALRMLMLGEPRELVMAAFGIKWTTLQKWVRFWNEGGIEKLAVGKPSGCPSKMTTEARDFVVTLVEFTHPKTGEKITGRFVSGRLKNIFGLSLTSGAVRYHLRKMGYSRIRPRTLPVARNEEAIEEFKIDYWALYSWCDVWFFDETGIENDARPRHVWVKKGSKAAWLYRGNHIRENIVGAVCPATGDLETLIMPRNDAGIFQLFLDYFKERTGNRPVVLILDNASWHKVKKLDWGNVVPVFLPPYAPELNPIEELWKVIKDRLCDPTPAKSHDELQNRIMIVLRELFEDKKQVQSICKLNYKIS
jgi:transposase